MVQKDNKILLHACCGICSGYPIALLKELGYKPVVYFCNPNLDTKDEFEKRLEAEKILCKYHWVDLITEDYNHQEFLDYVSGLENEPEKGKRCDKCIELRLKKTAKKATELGISKFTTSLVISPHKNFAKISKIGTECSENSFFDSPNMPEISGEENNGLEYIPIDFRKKDGFLKTNKLSKELGLYRQNYCGCEFAKKQIK